MIIRTFVLLDANGMMPVHVTRVREHDDFTRILE
jgi:hypothetical protein